MTYPERPPSAAAPDPASARIRNLAVDRLLRMNARHATHAWLQRRVHPVGPHGIAFLYYDQVPGAPVPTVLAATRLVDDTADVRALPRLLFRLANLARDRYAQPGGFDPRPLLANRQDPMSRQATYIGLGVSSLDSATHTWDRIQHAASGPLDLPGRCFALLGDGTHLLVDRGGQDVFGEVRLAATHDLNIEQGIASRRWAWRPDLATATGTAEIWPRLADLHRLIAGSHPVDPHQVDPHHADPRPVDPHHVDPRPRSA